MKHGEPFGMPCESLLTNDPRYRFEHRRNIQIVWESKLTSPYEIESIPTNFWIHRPPDKHRECLALILENEHYDNERSMKSCFYIDQDRRVPL